MKSLFTILRQDDFFRHNVIFFIGSMSVAVLNYLYHPVLGRIMSVEDFGEVQTLLSILTISLQAISVCGMISLHVFANKGDGADGEASIGNLYRFALNVALVMSIGIVFLSPVLVGMFRFHSAWPFVPLALSLLISVPLTFQRSFLQAKHRFSTVSYAGIIAAGGKLLFAVLFVLLGFAGFGAIGAFVVAQGIAVWYCYREGPGALDLFPHSFVPRFDAELRKQLGYGILVLAASGTAIFLTTADVVFVRYFFSPEITGLYSGIATIARIIFFATGFVAGVLLPSVKLRNDMQSNRRALMKAFLLLGIVGGVGLAVFSAAPGLVISMLIGHRYLPYASSLPALSLMIFLVSVMNLFAYYFMALRHFIVIPIAAAALAIATAGSILFHSSPIDIVWSFNAASGVAVVLFAVVLIRD